jgi:hypothetical protein
MPLEVHSASFEVGERKRGIRITLTKGGREKKK